MQHNLSENPSISHKKIRNILVDGDFEIQIFAPDLGFEERINLSDLLIKGNAFHLESEFVHFNIDVVIHRLNHFKQILRRIELPR